MQETLPLHFLRVAKQNLSGLAMQDSLGKRLTNFQLVVGSILMGQHFRKQLTKQQNIGIMLPASVGAALANISLSFIGKTPVNLNFTVGDAAVSSAVLQAGITTIITSRRFVEKAKIKLPDVATIYLEDVAELLQKQTLKKLGIAAAVKLLSPEAIWKHYGDTKQTGADLATIIFTSGTTGKPKGAMLSHNNIISNIEGVNRIYSTRQGEKILGVLPFFHCFGYTVTLWLPLLRGIPAFYHANPTEGKVIGKIVHNENITLFVTTPTFCQIYMRSCTKEQLKSLHCVWVGAEKLRDIVHQGFLDKFGIELQEGYGCTETGPAISVNIPGDSSTSRLGTVGKPLPKTEIKIVHIETGKPVKAGESGLLWVRSPSIMQGYLSGPSDKLDDGWYNTGDIAKLDADGFLVLTDRLDRFSKLGGEMVPHIRIEDEVNSILGQASSIVVAEQHPTKGEQLGILYVHKSLSPAQLHSQLTQHMKAAGMPNLWIPKRGNIFKVEELPISATGKPNLLAAKNMFADLLR